VLSVIVTVSFDACSVMPAVPYGLERASRGPEIVR
jgi:hypothetical protein